MKVEGIDHVHIFVKNLDNAIKFFEKALNTKFEEPMLPQNADGTSVEARIAMNALGLELIEGTSQESPVTKFVEQRGEGLAGLSLRVTNIEEAITHLEACGLRLIRRGDFENLKEAQFHPKDSFGLVLEISERK